MIWQVRKTPSRAADQTSSAGNEHTASSSEARTPNTPVVSAEQGEGASAEKRGQLNAHIDLKVRVHRQILDTINLSALDQLSEQQVSEQIGQIVTEILRHDGIALNRTERTTLVAEVLDELLGLGPLEPLLKDETINDILVNGFETVFVERFGVLERVGTRFQDERHLLRIIQKIVSAVGRRVDESSPFVDARLPDGSRVNAIVAPLAIDGSLLSIRKFSKKPISMARMIELGSLPPQVAELLDGIVAARLNVIISGGTGSGKTTMLNALSSYIDERERIVTIEDSAELQLQQAHVARLETRPPNIEGRGEVTQRDLVKNALRMRPDRIILGECRAGEAFDMLQAMNTGHDGSMTTVHANTPRDALSRIEQMIGMSGVDISARSARAQIAAAVNVVIQIGRLSDGKRKMLSLSEVTGMEGDTLTMQEIFRFRMTGRDEAGNVQGHFEATGIRPKFMSILEAHGINLSAELFRPDGMARR